MNILLEAVLPNVVVPIKASCTDRTIYQDAAEKRPRNLRGVSEGDEDAGADEGAAPEVVVVKWFDLALLEHQHVALVVNVVEVIQFPWQKIAHLLLWSDSQGSSVPYILESVAARLEFFPRANILPEQDIFLVTAPWPVHEGPLLRIAVVLEDLLVSHIQYGLLIILVGRATETVFFCRGALLLIWCHFFYKE